MPEQVALEKKPPFASFVAKHTPICFPMAEQLRVHQRKERQEKDPALKSLRAIAEKRNGWKTIAGIAARDRKAGHTTAHNWEEFGKLGVLFFAGGYVAIRSVRTDEASLNPHTQKYKQKKFLQVEKGNGRLKTIRTISVFQNMDEAIRSIIHTRTGSLESREKIFNDILNVMDDIDTGLKLSGRPLSQPSVERLALNYSEVVAQMGQKTHFFAKAGVALLEKGLALWNRKNFPALYLVKWGAERRFVARVGSISPVVQKARRRLELFEAHVLRQLAKRKGGTERLQLQATLCALKMCKRWEELHCLKWQLAKCFSDERNEKIREEFGNIFRIKRELQKTPRQKSISALYKYRAAFTQADMNAILKESKKKTSPDFITVFKRISASYWEWKFGAVLRTDEGVPIGQRMMRLAEGFATYELEFEDGKRLQRLFIGLFAYMFPKNVLEARKAFFASRPGRQHGVALDAFKRALAAKPTYLEMAEAISAVQMAMKDFRAEEAAGKLIAR